MDLAAHGRALFRSSSSSAAFAEPRLAPRKGESMAARPLYSLRELANAGPVALAMGLAVCLVTISVGHLPAQTDKYWDLNGATPGAGGPAPTGTWDTTIENWTMAALGDVATTTWVAGDIA